TGREAASAGRDGRQPDSKRRRNSASAPHRLPLHEPSFGARPVPGRSGSDSLLEPEPSPSRRLHSDPLRGGTSRAPDAGGFRGARRGKSSGRSLLGEKVRVRANQSSDFIETAKGKVGITKSSDARAENE